MHIRGIEGLAPTELEQQVAAGRRFVFFEYCISLVILTLRRPSNVYFLHAGEKGVIRGIPYSLISLVLGWWGVPWGLMYTPLTIMTNFAGGRDVTREVLASLHQQTEGTTAFSQPFVSPASP